MKAVTGYVLAGGRSSRMGQDKALLRLHGRTLIERAIDKLRMVADGVCILGDRQNLREYAEVVPDLRESCGPLGGAEAALANAGTEWVLLMAVDMPFVPAGLLRWMVNALDGRPDVRVMMFSAGGRPQPALALLHKDLTGSIVAALDRSERRLLPVLLDAGREVAQRRGVQVHEVVWVPEIEESVRSFVTEGQWMRREMWFANLNTPEELAAAEDHAGLLVDG